MRALAERGLWFRWSPTLLTALWTPRPSRARLPTPVPWDWSASPTTCGQKRPMHWRRSSGRVCKPRSFLAMLLTRHLASATSRVVGPVSGADSRGCQPVPAATRSSHLCVHIPFAGDEEVFARRVVVVVSLERGFQGGPPGRAPSRRNSGQARSCRAWVHH